MQNSILNYFGNEHAQYLHARGKIATKILIQTLSCQPDEKILEIGFGTGATLVHLFSTHKKTKFYGLEQSELMYKKAKARLRFCLIGEQVHLNLVDQKGQIPFEANSFDKVYLESVLAIQEGNDLKNFIEEIQRVLRPNGTLIMNETVWLDATTPGDILRMNESCKEMFGIIQCNSDYPYLKDWKNLLTHLNFECEFILKLDEVKDDLPSRFTFPYYLLSLAFTATGKIRALLSPFMRKDKKRYFQKMKQIHPDNRPVMEGVIIKVQNRK